MSNLNFSQLQGVSGKPCMKNLNKNWYFPFLAIATYIWASYGSGMPAYMAGFIPAFFMALLIASKIPSIAQDIKHTPIGMKIWCAISAVGIFLPTLYKSLLYLRKDDAIHFTDNLLLNSVMLFVAGSFIAISLVYFWKAMLPKLQGLDLIGSTTKREKLIYGIMFVGVIIATVIAFCNTSAFYSSTRLYDIVYTSDSTMLVGGDAYTSLTHGENDIRQPLFEFFAAPFMGVPYLIGMLFGRTQLVMALVYNIPQILLLFVANFMLAKLMKLNESKRVCWMLLCTVTYTGMLSVLMMEQYIFAYFFVVLCIYYMVNDKADVFLFCGAAGSLLTSAALLPVLVRENPLKNFKSWFIKCFKYGLCFLGLIFAGCKTRIFVELLNRSEIYGQFFKGENTWTDALYQYFTFIRNCIVAPNAGPMPAPNYGWASWQLAVPTTISIIGVAIMVLAGIGFIVNRKDKFAQVAGFWVLMSAVVLLFMGWGVSENGQILYSLYYGWPFVALLFMLVNKLEEKLKVKFIVPVATTAAVAVLAYINIPAIIEMTKYLASVYPA